MTALSGWENFYVIVGSSAGALIGLQFVVITLIADIPLGEGAAQAGSAFATPTIIHFGAALLLAGIQTIPWQEIAPVVVLWRLMGIGGIVYVAAVTRRLGKVSYKPGFEDWLFHALLPFVAYVTLLTSAFAARTHTRGALFGVAGVALLLLFVGIHNAWDAVTYHVFVQRQKQRRTVGKTKRKDGNGSSGRFSYDGLEAHTWRHQPSGGVRVG
jgi:hypothetical protein